MTAYSTPELPRLIVNGSGKYKYVTRGDRMLKCAKELGIFLGE